jgi:AcrR family transcriptional regulator
MVTAGNPEPSSREKLLAAAIPVFARAGFSGARVDEIARRARVNKAMIYYHFRTKRGLYQAVLLQLFSGVLSEMDRSAREEPDPRRRLVALYGRLARIFQAQPALPHIMLREVLGGGQQLRGELGRFLGALLDFIREALETGAERGLMRPANPLLVHLSMVGPIALYFASAPVRGRLLPSAAPRVEAPTLDDLLAHLETLIARGLQPDPAASPAATRARTAQELR